MDPDCSRYSTLLLINNSLVNWACKLDQSRWSWILQHSSLTENSRRLARDLSLSRGKERSHEGGYSSMRTCQAGLEHRCSADLQRRHVHRVEMISWNLNNLHPGSVYYYFYKEFIFSTNFVHTYRHWLQYTMSLVLLALFLSGLLTVAVGQEIPGTLCSIRIPSLHCCSIEIFELVVMSVSTSW